MVFDGLDSREKTVFFASLFLVATVFGASILQYLNPPVQVLEAKVFDVYVGDGNTFILTYGEGKLRLIGEYEIELDAVYRITYQSRARNVANVVLSVEKLS
jgi:hypothetical protein